MAHYIRQWLAYRELNTLAKAQNFDQVRPEKVYRVLQIFTQQQQNSSVNFSQKILKTIQARAALMRVWELARAQCLKDPALRFKWHHIMASCNALYDCGANNEVAWQMNESVSFQPNAIYAAK